MRLLKFHNKKFYSNSTTKYNINNIIHLSFVESFGACVGNKAWKFGFDAVALLSNALLAGGHGLHGAAAAAFGPLTAGHGRSGKDEGADHQKHEEDGGLGCHFC